MYGDNAQHLLRDKISYDSTSWEYIEEQSDFENDYKNKTLKNVSDYEEAYNRENRNFNFYNVL